MSECIKFRWWGAYSAPPGSLAPFKMLTSKEMEKEETGSGTREGEGRETEGHQRPYAVPVTNSWLRHCAVSGDHTYAYRLQSGRKLMLSVRRSLCLSSSEVVTRMGDVLFR